MIKFALYVCLGILTAQASTLFDANLASPNASAFPGWYDGTGNPNGGFTVDSQNGIELGLRVKLRQDPNVIDSPTDIYAVPAGPQPSSLSHAAWNYEFSIDLEPNGVGTLTLADISASLTITDVTTGATATINPLTYWNDDAGFGSSGKTSPESAAQWGAQNSENPIFGDFPLAADYNEGAARTYLFTLVVTNIHTTAILGSDVMQVNVTPEPATIGMIGLGIAMLLLGGKRLQTRR